MKRTFARRSSVPDWPLALLALVASVAAATSGATPGSAQVPAAHALLAQNSAPDKAAPASAPSAGGVPSTALVWTFGAPPPPDGNGWTAERGTLIQSGGEAQVQPDANRRVVLLSPPGLPEAARHAEAFVVGIQGTGLLRVRVQGRRDARGGWITLADASGTALVATDAGYVVKRKPGARVGAVERLRVELTFRTTNPRALLRIEAN
jgi:hypothetical protein